MRLSRLLYRTARIMATTEALTSGKPRRVARRGKNLLVGRTLARVGFFRWLWR